MRALRPILLAVVLLAAAPAAASAIVPAGFQESTVWTGFTNPTTIEFAADGRVFVGEKSGRIVSYDSLADPSPTPVADLSNAVHDFWDRGLLGMALDPDFTNGRPYIYVLYTYNKDPSDATVPRWPDNCPTPPGATADGCVVSGRLSRLTLDGVETPLITDWCQQYPSHSVGDLVFGPGRALYVSAGDGASFNFADYGQDGAPVNPCGDPGGAAPTPPTAEGGALRSQDIRSAGDPTGGDGAILRVDPDTGAALPDNPGRQRRPDDAPDRRARLPQPVPAHAPARHGRGLGRRRRLERVGGGRPDRRPDRGRRQLRLALLRGRRPDGLLRQPEPEPVRDALRAGRRRRRDAALHVPARRQGRPGRGVPGGRLRDRRAAVLHRHPLPRGVPRRPVLRGLHAQLHLVHAEGRRRAARPGAAPDVRLRRHRDREPDPGAGRQPLLPRPERRHRQADQLRLAQRRADRAGDGDAVERRRPARRPVRRHDLDPTRTATR